MEQLFFMSVYHSASLATSLRPEAPRHFREWKLFEFSSQQISSLQYVFH